jgi:glycine betaine/proline transport system ATP-binding protein
MPLLRVENLSKSFGAQAAVRGVSLEINRGEIFVVMGLSGSGKSTLLRMLNGLIHPSQGDVQVDGQWLSQLSGKELRELRRSQMAMVFQSFALFPNRTALENACFGLEIAGVSTSQRRERARLALERVGLGEALHKRPHELSGGMQQRVGLARALALDPPILLMDEAFSALDPLIRREMQDLLLELQQQQRRTVIFITHDLDEAVHVGDRVALMHSGSLLQCGSPRELLCRPASEQVRRFFNSVDPTGVLCLADLELQPISGASSQSLQRLPSSTLLREAIDVVAQTQAPLAVEDAQGAVIGTLDSQGLLRAMVKP